ncbi:MAG: PASTA domain-containing protein [Rhodothermales bacterium]|nr:PASTA domain-containing protein [Rhodothermales bacterium]
MPDIKLHPLLERSWLFLKDLLSNPYFGIGMLGLGLFIGTGYIVFDKLIMPNSVGHRDTILVPDVSEMPVEQAEATLRQLNLQARVESSRFNPKLPRDVVVDQSPRPNRTVKPGRRIYLTINSGSTPRVTVPDVEGISQVEALNRLAAAGLRAEPSDIQPDSIPHPHRGTITRQFPPDGTVLEEGSRVRLWYSTGLGDQFVAVPDLQGLTVREARQLLLARRLRSVVMGAPDDEATASLPVVKQGYPAGTRLKEGHEIRLFVQIDPVDDN